MRARYLLVSRVVVVVVDVAELERLLLAVEKSEPLLKDLHALALQRSRPCLELRLALWAALPASQAKYEVRAWRHRGVPYLPTYHIVTARDTWCGREGAWLTAVQLCRRLEGLVERATVEAPQQLAYCHMALAEVGVRLEAAEADPRVHTLPPSLYRAATGMGACWPRREPEAGVAGCEAGQARWGPGPGSGCWKLACKRGLSDAVETGEEVGHKGADAARCKVAKFFVEK